MNRSRVWLGALAVQFVVVLALAASVGVAQVALTEADEALTAAVSDMEAATPDQVFAAAATLNQLGGSAVEAAAAALSTATPKAQLGLASYLLAFDRRDLALQTLVKLVGADDQKVARLAAELLGRSATRTSDINGLKPMLEVVRDAGLKIAIAKTLRDVARDTQAEGIIKDYLNSTDYNVRAHAAFALAELGNVQIAKPVLAQLADEPTERGRYARSLLYQEKLFESLQRSNGLAEREQIELLRRKNRELEKKLSHLKDEGSSDSAESAFPLLTELKRHIQLYYVDDSKNAEAQALLDQAAKGMVGSLDPFSSYMTEKETTSFNESMQGEYAGIGAVVSIDPKDKLLTIIRPIYSGPAYKAGLRSLDKITEVAGKSTFGKTVQELVGQLKGPAGTPVDIKVYRKSWEKERQFELTRAHITLESVHTAMLPGKIGYLALSQFGQHASEEVEEGLRELEEQGMRALIFDLRANPGGLLSAAVEISDKFLKDNKLIVYSKGRNKNIAPRREFRTKESSTHPEYPIVCLINGASASASEIVAGALQDHKRALLIGETSFGKGSVQQLIRVRTTGGKSTLRLTIAKYYLPSGRSIHKDPDTDEGGVHPDIVVAPPTFDPCDTREMERLATTLDVERFAEKLWAENQETMATNAVCDQGALERYPGFDDWYKSLETTLSKDLTRTMLRTAIRRFAQDKQAKEFAHDFQEDVQLQRAIHEHLKTLGESLATYPEYTVFAEKFAAKPPPASEAEAR